MQIKYISIKGYRSFNDEEGIELKDLKRFNLFIGPNNAGKTNLMRFFLMLSWAGRQLAGSKANDQIPNDLIGDPSDADAHLRLGDSDFWSKNDRIINAEIRLSKQDVPFIWGGEFISKALKDWESFHLIRVAVSGKGSSKFDWNKFPVELYPAIPISRKAIALLFNERSERIFHHPNQYQYLSEVIEKLPDFPGLSSNYKEVVKDLEEVLSKSLAPEIKLNSRATLYPRTNQITGIGSHSFIGSGDVIDFGGSRPQMLTEAAWICKAFLKPIFAISAIRHESRSTSLKKLGDDGANLVTTLSLIRTSATERDKWDSLHDKLLEWLRQILQEDTLQRFEIVDNSQIEFQFLRGGTLRRQFLYELGSGISQLFILLTTLYLEKDSPRYVFLDEPENCVHPAAILEFMKILQEQEFQKHQFFISSHSNALLDAFEDDFTIHRVTMDKDRGTIMTPCISRMDHLQLLNRMGYRASQILQTNFVIWVEGPSDRLYIKAWLDALAKDKFLENKHYAFLFYGGAVLKHLGDGEEEENEDRLSIFATSRYGCVVMDSDRKQKDAKDRPAVRRIKTLFPNDREDGECFVGHWITSGREIENYIPAELWGKVAAMKGFQKQSVVLDGKQIPLTFEMPIDFELDLLDDFAVKLASLYRYSETEGDKTIINARIKAHHDDLKVEMASELAGKWNAENMHRHNLKAQVQQLIQRIEAANGMPITRA